MTWPTVLTFEQVHRIRSEGRRDSYFARVFGIEVRTIRRARIGETHKRHPTPADTIRRTGKGSRASMLAHRVEVRAS